jgi:hypothetical protein
MAKELTKHKKYKSKYGENELFWGLGIEEETYLQFTKPIFVATPIIRQNHKEERYSVNYYASFKPGYEEAFEKVFPDASGCVAMPLFVNSHCLSKLDTDGNHDTTYEKVPQPNPKFKGKTLFTELQEFCPGVFKEEYEKNFTFDGDSIEFMTLDFYKATVGATIKELIDYKQAFLQKINAFLLEKKRWRDKGLLEWPRKNPGWAVFYSNPRNVAMFNNGTYHINITLPSLLGAKDTESDLPPPLLYPDIFQHQHKKAILLYQWLEPLLIAVYGSPDPFSTSCTGFAKGSQRCAISRYIGVGTYDTSVMKEGKILTQEVTGIRGADMPFWWYGRFHAISAYNGLNKIGLDINYKKHYNHGIELRFFDWFHEDWLGGLLTFLVGLADCALDRPEADEPALSETWNDLVFGVFTEGGQFIMTGQMTGMYEKILGIELPEKINVLEGFALLAKEMKVKYKEGVCSRVML